MAFATVPAVEGTATPDDHWFLPVARKVLW
jgi:hypothetical protein